MKFGVLVDGQFEERNVYQFKAKGFSQPVLCREGTYDEYVCKEINRSYGRLDVKDRVVLDVGANIGAFTCWALQKGAEKVIAVEPEENNFNMLVLNTQPYTHDHSFILCNSALTKDKDGEGVLYLSKTGKNPGNSSTTPRRGRVEVPINYMTVSELKKRNPEIHVAKIDCEGAEYDFIEELILSYPMLKQVALEMHINGFGLEKAEKLHSFMFSQEFNAVVPPRLDNEKLWQTLATYERM